MSGSQRQRQGRAGGIPAAGRPAAGVHQARRSTTRTSASRSASPSSAAARPAWPRPTACCSCWPTMPARRCSSASGEVPVAVIEKAKICGGHNLSGAVMRPGPLQELFPDLTREDWRKEGFAFGEVHKEAVYLTPSAKIALRIPTPPPFKNHGNEVISVSALARYQQRLAEEAGAYVLTETAATQLLVEDGRVVGVRSGDKGRGKDGEPLGNFEPGTDITAQFTVLAEGCWGHLTGAAIREFDLGRGRRAAGLGARGQGGLEGPQAAGPPDPHDRPVAAEALVEVRPDRRHLDLPDEGREDRRRPRLDRLRRRPRVRRRHHVGPRPAAAVQDRTRWSARSSRAASASAGAPRRCRAAATGRCPS